jgi:hypothetical protein
MTSSELARPFAPHRQRVYIGLLSGKALYRLQYIMRALLHLVLIDQLGISAEVQRGVVQDLWGLSAARYREAVRDATSQSA